MLERLSQLLRRSPPAARISTEARRLIAAFVAELEAPETFGFDRPGELATGRAVLESPEPLRVEVLLGLFSDATREERSGRKSYDRHWYNRVLGRTALMSQLLRRRLPLTPEQLELLAGAVAQSRYSHSSYVPLKPVLNALVAFVEEGGTLTAGTLRSLERFQAQLRAGSEANADSRRLLAQADQLLGTRVEARPTVEAGEPWADAVLAHLARTEGPARDRWGALLRHAGTANASQPTKRWMEEARGLVGEVGAAEGPEALVHWLQLAAQPAPAGRPQFSEHNGDVLKGLCWVATLLPPEDVGAALRELGATCFQKVPGEGARSVKVGNACLWALGALPGKEGVARLGQLRLAVKYPSARKLIDKALEHAAEQAGMGVDELGDLAVPTFGLEADGTLRRVLGEATARVAIAPDGAVHLEWESAGGRLQRSVPAAVRREHAGELDALKRLRRDVEQMLTAQAGRLEQTYLGERVWTYDAWREHCLEHPLVSRVARRLLWEVRRGAASTRILWNGEAWVDVEGRPVATPDATDEVRLWHPIDAPAREVLAWRQTLLGLGLSQPFKQAHREVYLLTEAERRTRTYSNRFAGHILRQHQLAALCQQRGWRYHLQGAWDSFNVPTLELPRWNLRAELGLADHVNDVPLAGSGVLLYVPTNQVRFLRGGEPLPLEEVPPRVFSEVMRDVDLFVGVTSIGNDPQWMDRGEVRRFDGYWRDYAFGDLSPTAQTRREVLEHLIPRLRIADRLRLEGRFLIVRGDRRTYRIHLGSSNILMEPNDQYLCIVQDRAHGGSEQVMLPFEGDGTLALILSKAFLLAEDRRISDPTILRQLEQGA